VGYPWGVPPTKRHDARAAARRRRPKQKMPRRFLTYGSACQDCGFNNQRIDLEAAAQLALASDRILVVRNFACSPHARCPTSNASSDGVIAALGGVAAWRAICSVPGKVVCDKNGVRKDDGTRWGTGVHFQPARLFVDPAYFTRVLRLKYLWTDDFHAQHAALLRDPASWVMVQRPGMLSPQRRSPRLCGTWRTFTRVGASLRLPPTFPGRRGRGPT